MIAVLQAASETVFVPLTVGGGIREYTDPHGNVWSALDVAAQYRLCYFNCVAPFVELEPIRYRSVHMQFLLLKSTLNPG
jgi:hypothetical protein